MLTNSQNWCPSSQITMKNVIPVFGCHTPRDREYSFLGRLPGFTFTGKIDVSGKMHRDPILLGSQGKFFLSRKKIVALATHSCSSSAAVPPFRFQRRAPFLRSTPFDWYAPRWSLPYGSKALDAATSEIPHHGGENDEIGEGRISVRRRWDAWDRAMVRGLKVFSASCTSYFHCRCL